MAETAALSPDYLKQLRVEREARLAAKEGDDAVIEIESNSDSDEVQLIVSPPKRKRADDGSDDDVQILPSPPKRPSKADDEVEVLDRPPPRSSTGGTFSCVICMDDVERSQRLKLRNCGHAFCGECVAGTLKAALDDRKVDDRLRCPDTTCRKPLDVLDVRACTYDRGDKATWSKYQEVATEALLDQANADEGNEKGLRRCPGDKCNHTFYYEPHATSGTLHICQKCHGAFCLGCPLVGGKARRRRPHRRDAAHSSNPTGWTGPRRQLRLCDAAGGRAEGAPGKVRQVVPTRVPNAGASMAWRSRFRRRSIENAQADEKFNELMRKERQKGATKPCPKCKQAITKNHGCDHMT